MLYICITERPYPNQSIIILQSLLIHNIWKPNSDQYFSVINFYHNLGAHWQFLRVNGIGYGYHEQEN